jgi:uncharacterized membrane protein YjjP (DUF1212 family)
MERAERTRRAPAACDDELRCVLSLGCALLSYGLPAHRVAEAVVRLSRGFGHACTVFTLPTFLSITLTDERGQRSYQAHVEASTIDLSRLDALHAIVGGVERGEVDRLQADRLVRTTLATSRPRPLELAAVTLVAAGGTWALSGSTSDAALAGGLGLLVGGGLWLSHARPALARVLPVLCAILTTMIATELARRQLFAYPLLAVFSALFVFVPGLALTQSMTELATGHLVSGTARMVGAVTVFLQLGLGILLGARLAGLATVSSAQLGNVALGAATSGSALLALGFALLFAVRPRDALSTAAISALAFGVCRLAGAWLGPEPGALLAAAAVGLSGHAFARRYDRPSSVLSLPGMAMLVPGSLGLLSVSAAVLQEPGRALAVGVQMAMTLVSLSTGVLLAAAVLPPRSEL